ncbi:kinase A anchor protein [Daldinia caldariorum]|uniref:kinase A anchor protein n=1 Tax=Daldinia caldariorum TaxID=326644 RepID=UPI002007BE9D|nr:kinase A anchor protein [Daldinia caldariorum]KAI1471182.1 kinase A anchor protein [Daldinia caldariorum]
MPPRPSPTHFLCLPLVTGASRHQLSTSLSAFSADVTSPDNFAVPEQAIRPLGTLHLTIGVMSFPKDDGLDKAVALLKTLVPRKMMASIKAAESLKSTERPAQEPTGPPPPLLSVTLKGLHSMQPASKASVLYAPPVDTEGTLFKFCESLRSAFQEAGLMAEENRPLLLHATIMNTIYVKGRSRKSGKRSEKLTIDARDILDRYHDHVWMEDVPVEKIAICKMGAKKQEDGDEAYEVEAEIDLTC